MPRGTAVLLLCQFLFSLALQANATEYSGLVWKRQGDWHLNGSPADVRLGEAIPQGGLLTASAVGSNSLVILLPDGQRLLFECYQVQTCVQGFRVPAIASPPNEKVWTMFKAVRDVLLLRGPGVDMPFPPTLGRDGDAANIEMVAPLEAGSVSIAPALRALPAGTYRLITHRDGPRPGETTSLPERPLDWNPAKPVKTVPVAEPGLYRIAVIDNNQVPRMELEVLAVPSGLVDAETEALKNARATVIGWSKVHEGWSLHDFLRAYLQSRAVSVTR